MDSGKSIWVVLLALLGVTLLWLYATGKGQAFWAALQTAYKGNVAAAATPAPGTSSGATSTAGTTNAFTPSVPQLVTTSLTQSLPQYIPAVSLANLTQSVGATLNPATLAPVSAYGSIPTYISNNQQPAYTSNPLLGYGFNLSSFAAPASTQSGNDPGLLGTVTAPLNALGQVTDDPYYGAAPGAPSSSSDSGLVYA